MKYLMKCGHVAQAFTERDRKKVPICAICAGINPDASVVEKEARGTDGLEGRHAKCRFCKSKIQSSWDLPFFEYKPKEEEDSYYDGCFGWD